MDAKCAREDNISLEQIIQETSLALINCMNILKLIDISLNGPILEKENNFLDKPNEKGLYEQSCILWENADKILNILINLQKQLSRPKIQETAMHEPKFPPPVHLNNGF